MSSPDEALEARELVRSFMVRGGLRRREVRAVDRVTLQVRPGRTLALVGESGCGKSTLGRMMCGLLAPTSGEVLLDGQPAPGRTRAARRSFRKQVQMVFQDPGSSLNPRKTVGAILEAPLKALGADSPAGRRARIRRALELAALPEDLLGRHPHTCSGGQMQRVAIARALVVEPRFLVLDEAVSALDVSVQARILDLLADLQQRLGMGYLFISHDLAVVESLCDEAAVMYLGRLVETGTREQLFRDPRHPYTRALLSAVPLPGEVLDPIPVEGDPPDPARPPPGCAFEPRCYRAEDRCAREDPHLADGRAPHAAACFFAHDSDWPRAAV